MACKRQNRFDLNIFCNCDLHLIRQICDSLGQMCEFTQKQCKLNVRHFSEMDRHPNDAFRSGYQHGSHHNAHGNPHENQRMTPNRRTREPVCDTNALMLRNLSYRTTDQTLKDKCSQFGEIAKFSGAQIATRGICFVTYYDSRCAAKAMEMMNNVRIDGRLVQTCPALLTKAGREDLINQPVLLRSVDHSPHALSIEKYREFIESQFGEIAQISPRSHGEIQVDFYDARAANKLLDERRIIIDGIKWLTGTVKDIKDIKDRPPENSASPPRSANLRKSDNTPRSQPSRDAADVDPRREGLPRNEHPPMPYAFQKPDKCEMRIVSDIGSGYVRSLEILKSRIGV